MATLSAPFLQPPAAQEDSMELSSPANRPLDDDIDIELDADYEARLMDDHMADDADLKAPEQDEDMINFDDDDGDIAKVDETRRFSTIPDEDLIDYSEDEYEAPKSATVASKPPSLPDTSQVVADLPDETAVEPDNQDNAVEAQSKSVIVEETVDDVAEQPLEEEQPQAGHLNAKAPEFVPAQPETDEQEHNGLPDEGDQRPGLSTTSFQDTDVPGIPADTGLHPVSLYYLDQVYSLFRTRTSTECLLKDDNLASVSLADLIKACRQSLIMRTRQEISDDLEMVLTLNQLTLFVVEDCPASFQTSLKEVLDVYTNLQSNDGHDEDQIPPLDITCSLQIKFNNSIHFLRQAAERGEGLSSIALAHVDDDTYEQGEQEHDDLDEQAHAEEGDYDEEEYHEGYTAEGEQLEAEQDGEQQFETEQAEEDEAYDETEERDAHSNETEHAQEAEEQFEAAEHVETADDDYDEAAQPHEDDEAYQEDGEYYHADQHNETAELDDEEQVDPAAEVEQNTPATLPAADSASTATVQASEDGDAHDSHHDLDGEVTSAHKADHSHDQAEEDQADESAIIPAADDDEIDFDLEDYTHPEVSLPPSPAAKRQRETDGATDDSSASKKLKPS